MKSKNSLKSIVLMMFLVLILSGCSSPNNSKAVLENIESHDERQISESIYSLDMILADGYKILEVGGGDLSGDRQANVVVDIGYGD